MKLKELRQVCAEAELMIQMQITILRRRQHETVEAEVRSKLMLADFLLLKREMRDHIDALESILTVCHAVAAGRYLEDWQQCTRWAGTCHGCTAPEACDNFDGRTPHAVIASLLAELAPLSDGARQWILFQEDYQRHRRNLMFGAGGLFGDAQVVMYHEATGDDGEAVLVPMSAEASAAAMAQRDAQKDAANASVARRLDQYDLNRERLAYLCTVQGDLQEIAAIIEGGMPPQVRREIVAS
jgi:hypothetical protein